MYVTFPYLNGITTNLLKFISLTFHQIAFIDSYLSENHKRDLLNEMEKYIARIMDDRLNS